MAKNSGCFTTTAVAFGIFLIVGIIGHGVSPNAPDPNQAAQDREQTKEKAQKASDEAAADLKQAQAWGVSLAVYERAKAQQDDAYVYCMEAVKKAARFDVKSDVMPNYSWGTDGNTLTIFGHDLHLQNGFGAYGNSYHCEWDMSAKKIISVGDD